MRLSIVSLTLLLSLFLFSLFVAPTLATKKSYIVYLGAQSHGANPTSADIDTIRDSHYGLLESFSESKEKAKERVIYSYTKSINGFAAFLDEEEAAALAGQKGVVSVFENKARKLHTTRSWAFMGLEQDGIIHESSIWKKARFGQDVIIANLDTGVWPESKSFSDEDMDPVPSRWRGTCQQDVTTKPVRCNRKLIGAKYFNKGYSSVAGPLNSTFYSARDKDGHGTHTLSTAGGNFVPGASVCGQGNGTAKGGSSKARVAAYKVCWPPINGGGCFDADILAAFDNAISDGVDVISVSLGGSPDEFFYDGTSIGAFHAVKAGITVVASAGNKGPAKSTVTNLAPWFITVGASTMDREFSTWVALGNRIHLKGQSLSQKRLPGRNFYPLISGSEAKLENVTATDALLCKPDTLDSKKVKGKIVACIRGVTSRVNKGLVALQAGAVGMILANDEGTGGEILADAHLLPAAHISYTDGKAVFNYLNSTKAPFALITKVNTKLEIKAPLMAAFSSRGPNVLDPSILKPDITAPGVNVIAAFSEANSLSEDPSDTRRTPFQLESGTSMSCPHVSGIVGLLKTVHPDWSPAAIKSAIMTTARTRTNKIVPITDSSTNLKADPFAYGTGHVNPNKAVDPGLIYDLTVTDYLHYLCSRGYSESQIKIFSEKPFSCSKSFSMAGFNYPSITVTNLTGPVTVTRTVRNVGPPATYAARVKAPKGVRVSVEPKELEFVKTNQDLTYKVTFDNTTSVEPRDFVFGALIWSDGTHYVRSPLVVTRS